MGLLIIILLALAHVFIGAYAYVMAVRIEDENWRKVFDGETFCCYAACGVFSFVVVFAKYMIKKDKERGDK